MLVPIAAPVATHAAQPDSKGKVLVVMSGAHLLNLQEGKVYASGYYLNELATPLAAIVKAGYSPEWKPDEASHRPGSTAT